MEFKTLNGSRRKYGWEEFPDGDCIHATFPSDPPKIAIYKTELIENTWQTGITNGASLQWKGVFPMKQTLKVIDADTGMEEVIDIIGHYDCLYTPNPPCSSDWVFDPETHGGWDNLCPGCGDVDTAFIEAWNLADPSTKSSGSDCWKLPLVSYLATMDVINNPGGLTAGSFTTNLVTLSDEYTTAELVGRVRGDLDAQPYPEGWGGGNCASLHLSEDETHSSASKFRVKFSFDSEAGRHYTLKWKERTILSDTGECGSAGTAQFDTEREVALDGSGGVVEHEEEVRPPDAKGWTQVVDAMVCYTDNGGTGPGPNPVEPPQPGHDPGRDGDFAPPPFVGPPPPSGGDGDCGTCADCGPGGAVLSLTQGGAEFRADLGGTGYGERAGALYFKEALPGARLGTPETLHVSRRLPEIDVITDPSGWVRQVKAREALADIVIDNAFKYSIRMFSSNNVGAKIGGVYAVSNQPFVTYTIENPNGLAGDYNTLLVTETGGPAPIVNTLIWEPENARWRLSKGNGLRTERMQVLWANNATIKFAIYNLLNPTNGAAYYTATMKSQVFPWGEELIEKRFTAGADERLTTYSYWVNPSDNGYGKLKQATYPSGAWQYFEYDSQGRTARVFSSFLNQSFTVDPNLCRVAEWDYTTLPAGSGDNGALKPRTPRRIIESLKGIEVSRTYWSISSASVTEYRCQTRAAAWNASDNLKTTTTYYTSGSFANEIWKLKNPDGTMQFHTYSTDPAGKTTVVASGQPNGGESDIADGTRTTTLTSLTGQTLAAATADIVSGVTLDSAIYSNFDSLGRAATVAYLGGIVGYKYDCCGLAAVTNHDGTVSSYSYDALKRRVTETVNGITRISNYDMQGMVSSTVRQGTDSSQMTLSSSLYDGFGRVATSFDALGNPTGYGYSTDGSGQAVITTTYPNLGTRIETYAKDGALIRLTGTAVFPARHEYGVESDGAASWAYHKEIKLNDAGADTAEWTKTYMDMLSREFRTYYAKAAALYPLSQSFYNNAGQLWKRVDPDNVTRLSQYNAKGEAEYDVLDMNRNGIMDVNGPDRITRTVRDVIANYGTNVRRTRTYIYTNDTTSATLLASTVEASADGLRTWTTRAGAISLSQTVYNGGGVRTMTEVAPDQSSVVSVYQGERLQSVTRLDALGVQLSQTVYGYDPHGRQQTISDARNGTSTYTYTAADLIESVTTPPPGDGKPAQTRTNYYDNMLRVWKVANPDGTSLTNEYYLPGTRKKIYGSRAYPVEYTYDAQGRVKTMKTWQNFSSGTGAATTTWNYDPYRGFITSKLDNSNKGPVYTYTAAGRLSRIDRARAGQYVIIGPNNAGEESTRTYPAGGPAGITFGYDRAGRLKTALQNSTTITMFYNDASQLISESRSGGVWNGLAVTNVFDGYLRRTQMSLKNGGTVLATAGYGYDDASRLGTAGDGTYSARYAYLANSGLLDQVTFKQSSTVRLTTTQQHDHLNRLTQISSAPGGAGQLPASFRYTYNTANQRRRTTLADSSFWVYEYDALGQVTSGKRYWSDWTLVPGQQFEYGFDDIGNRTSTKAGGDAAGGSLRAATYTPNLLNQYASRAVPGGFDVLGIANAAATVTVNNLATYRKGEYYHLALSVNNASSAVFQPVSSKAVNGASTTTVTGNVFVPKTPEVFAHDDDGNLTSDGRWTYTWDAENRLAQMETLSTLTVITKKRVTFEYDFLGRRIRKLVYHKQGNNWILDYERRYIYDGWNLAAELNASNGVLTSFLWGLDLSGSEQGAGGVGGLLAVKPSGSPAQFVMYDGNGNVVGLVDGSTGTVSAQYEYGPFGEPIRVSGAIASANPFRFSTKFTDSETGLVYYGFRYYNPGTGRWLSRDPIGEKGSPNLYAFAKNASVNFIDALGLLVVGAFDIGTGTLTITDSDTGQTIVLCGESGGKPFGDPIPTGEYEILDHPSRDFFRLDPVDEVPRNDIHEPTKRDHFRLHKPGRTIGCIAAKKECGDCWNKVVDLIRGTQTEDVQVTTQRKWPLGPVQETLKKFGDFRVIDSSKNSVPAEKFNPCKCVCK